LVYAPQLAQAQKGSSIVIHDNTTQANGGENATAKLRSEIESALNKDKPCVDIMDDEDIRNIIESERQKEILEGSDPGQVLKDLGNQMGASYIMSVSAIPGVGGSTSYSVFVMDPQTAKTIARQTGTDEKEIAKSIMGQIGSNLTDNCKPHWIGVVKYEYISNDSKITNDKGAAHASTRNTKRTKTDTYTAQNTVTATLLPPKPGSDISTSKVMARVWMKSSIVSEKKQETSGEVYCRPKGGNSYWTGYTLTFSETFTQTGGGADNLPVYISIYNDGNYKIAVTSPKGRLLSRIVTRRSESDCTQKEAPTIDAQDMPEQIIDESAFAASGKTNSKNPETLTGTQKLPDGKSTISWNLKLVKPKK
jgi:hypothetical protein